MNSRKVRYSCFVVCLSVLLGPIWTAPAAGDMAGSRLSAAPVPPGPSGSSPPKGAPPSSAAPAGGILLKSEIFSLTPPEDPTATVFFRISGPGTVILETTMAKEIGMLGIVARKADSNAVSLRKDGPAGQAPLRMEIQVTSEEFNKSGSKWFAFPTLLGANQSLYPSPSVPMLVGELKIRFIPASISRQGFPVPLPEPNKRYPIGR